MKKKPFWQRISSMNKIKVSKIPQENWENDHLQFARLLAEAVAVDAFSISDELMETMDLSKDEIIVILTRAENAWMRVKAKT